MAQRGRGATAGVRRERHDDGDAPVRRPGPDLAAARTRLRSVIEPIVVAAELDLDDLVVTRAGRRLLVRVTVDGDAGLGHDELSEVSRQISAGLDAAEEAGGEVSPDSYTLEVSSPGIDRPLTLGRHWRRNVGRLVKVKAGDRGVTGRILAVEADAVSLDIDGHHRTIALAELGPGHVQIEFTRLDDLADEDLADEDLGEDFAEDAEDADDEDSADEDDADEDDADEDSEDADSEDADGHGPREQEDGA